MYVDSDNTRDCKYIDKAKIIESECEEHDDEYLDIITDYYDCGCIYYMIDHKTPGFSYSEEYCDCYMCKYRKE